MAAPAPPQTTCKEAQGNEKGGTCLSAELQNNGNKKTCLLRIHRE